MNDKICGYYLDQQQQQIVLDDSKNLLVVAGAGSGKTLTIVGKIYYLIKHKRINPNEILCISFTRAASNSLNEKIKKELKLNIPVYTFHKLSLEILKNNQANYQISPPDTLETIIHLFFSVTVLSYPEHMKIILYYFKMNVSRNIKEKYLDFYKHHYQQIELLSRLILTFIHLFKCNNYNLSDFIIFLKQAKKTFSYKKFKKEKIFLILALNIYLLYQRHLIENNEIDFDDMIIMATKQVTEKGINKNYKYIIIDEYQDTSYIRFSLIKSILNKTGAKLMVVGDDFQSIYRFTGCDLSLFVNFNKYFDETKIMKIETTYRNSQELINIVGKFVMKNKIQIKKNLVSNKSLNRPIKIVYYQDIKDSFLKIVLKIYKETNKPILVLGRNNQDINLILGKSFELSLDGKIKCLSNSNININFLTAHKSKGLEEENVIIINLEDKLLGFPNKIKNDSILRFVNHNCEKYPYSEERRLFYVALTRTKNNVYLMTQRNNCSIFIKEIVKKHYKEIEIIDFC